MAKKQKKDTQKKSPNRKKRRTLKSKKLFRQKGGVRRTQLGAEENPDAVRAVVDPYADAKQNIQGDARINSILKYNQCLDDDICPQIPIMQNTKQFAERFFSSATCVL